MPKEVGGARGEIAGGISVNMASRTMGPSRRSETGAIISDIVSVAIAELVALHTGHMWEEAGAALKSAQKWNCAPRKTAAKSSAKRAIRSERGCMCLVRRSLGKIGCGVKLYRCA